MDAAPRFFRVLPKAKLEVRAVEAWRQETASVAFYNQPAPDGSRPGIFYVNLADMNQVQKPQVAAIARTDQVENVVTAAAASTGSATDGSTATVWSLASSCSSQT